MEDMSYYCTAQNCLQPDCGYDNYINKLQHYDHCYYDRETKNYYNSYEHQKFLAEHRKHLLDNSQQRIFELENMLAIKEADWQNSIPKQIDNGLYVYLQPQKMLSAEVISGYNAYPYDMSSQNDVVVNVKEDDDQSGRFKIRLMSDNISMVVGKDGEELPATREVSVEVPVEVIKEVSVEVSVDMTDEIQKQQLEVLKSINVQLSSLYDEAKDAKYQDVLSSISKQLSSMTWNSDLSNVIAKYKDVYGNDLAAVRTIYG